MTLKRAIHDFEEDLQKTAGSWYSDQWIEQNLSNVANHLDEALVRWRRLYRSAKQLLARSTQRIGGGRLNGEELRKEQNFERQAIRQLNLLRNDLFGRSSELSEFYPFRYLASEGFLPGYNFTRLPIRVFLPTSDSSGEFVSRPRPIALREFGPLNVIYHNGRKYRVCQLVVQDAESALDEAKISKKAGYFLTKDQKDLEICPFSGVSLATTRIRSIYIILSRWRSLGPRKLIAFPVRRRNESRAALISRLTFPSMAAILSG